MTLAQLSALVEREQRSDESPAPARTPGTVADLVAMSGLQG